MLRVPSLARVPASWIANWLTGRRQIQLNENRSSWKDVLCGVPQGSVLGSLLFIIYINGLERRVTSSLSKFADYTKLGVM